MSSIARSALSSATFEECNAGSDRMKVPKCTTSLRIPKDQGTKKIQRILHIASIRVVTSIEITSIEIFVAQPYLLRKVF